MKPEVLNLWEQTKDQIFKAEHNASNDPVSSKDEILLAFLFGWLAIRVVEGSGEESRNLIRNLLENDLSGPLPNDAAWGMFNTCIKQSDRIPIFDYIRQAKKTLNQMINVLPPEYFLPEIK